MRCAEEPGRRNSEKKKTTLEQRDGVKIQHVSRTGVVASPESGRKTARHLAATAVNISLALSDPFGTPEQWCTRRKL